MKKLSLIHAQPFLRNKNTVLTMGGTVALRSPIPTFYDRKATDLNTSILSLVQNIFAQKVIIFGHDLLVFVDLRVLTGGSRVGANARFTLSWVVFS